MHRLASHHATEVPQPAAKIAYIMSRFPKLTETFVFYEILALEARGVAVEAYPLLHEHQRVAHPEVELWLGRARFQPFISLSILRAHAHFLRRNPGTYGRTLWEILRHTWGSLNFFVGALGIFPKTVYFAYEMQARGITHVHAHFANHPAVAVLSSHPTKEGKREGIPVALMEAMACGLPVVATAISGIPELLESGRTGYLVPPRDPWRWPTALRRSRPTRVFASEWAQPAERKYSTSSTFMTTRSNYTICCSAP